MKPKELMTNALWGLPTPRVPRTPLAVHFCATHAGVSLRSYSTEATSLAAAIINYYEDFRPDAVWISADTWVTAEAMGATIDFPGENEPPCGIGGPLIETLDDIAAIPAADPLSQGRQPMMLEAVSLVRKAIGDEAFVIGCFDQSPFSLACAMAGIDRIMMKLKVDPPFVAALLERCVEYALAYALAMAEAGADMLTTGDSPAGLIGPELYRQVALPAERRVFNALREQTDTFVSLHICGDTTSLLGDMATSDAHVLELDHAVDITAACHVIPNEIAIMGNIDPVGVLLRGTPGDVENACRVALDQVKTAGRRRFVLASGCTLAPATPAANVYAFLCAGIDG